MIKSKNYEEGTYEYVLARFCEALKARDWSGVAEFCTHSFKNGTTVSFGEPLSSVFREGSKIKDITYYAYETRTQVVFKPCLKIEMKTGRIIDVNLALIKQDRKRCLAHEAGDWGVDPESFRVLGVIDNIEPAKVEAKTTTEVTKSEPKKKVRVLD